MAIAMFWFMLAIILLAIVRRPVTAKLEWSNTTSKLQGNVSPVAHRNSDLGSGGGAVVVDPSPRKATR